MAQELVRVDELDPGPDEEPLEAPRQRLGRPDGRRSVRLAVGGEALHQRRRPAVVDLEALLGQLL